VLGVGLGAGIEQPTNGCAGYGQGASGYAKRYAAQFADGRSSDFLTHAVFPSLFHQDPRYYYQGARLPPPPDCSHVPVGGHILLLDGSTNVAAYIFHSEIR
jgi:hypothetical protein